MSKYYRLSLNCARVGENAPFTNSCGFLRVFPIRSSVEKKGLFGPRMVASTEYIGKFYIIAILKGDHFVEVIRSKNVYYDENGLKDITTATNEELSQNLSPGLTCHSFREIDEEVAMFYVKKIINDPKALEKYDLELEEIYNKENVYEELAKREENMINNKRVSAPPVRKLKREIRSA